MSWESWFVVATNRIELQVESASQNSTVHIAGRRAASPPPSVTGIATAAEGILQAVQPHNIANATYKTDQVHACEGRRKNGSIANG